MAKFLNFKKNSKDPSAETQPANSTAVANEVVSEPENVSQNIDSVVEEKYFGKSLGYLSDEKRRLAERSEALKRRLGEIKLSYNDLIRERERVSEEQQQALSDFNEASLESFKNELFAENNEENPVNPADAEGVAGELISQKKERLQSMKQVENEKDERCSALDQALFDKAEEMDSIQKEIDEIFHTNQAIEAAIADAGSDEQEPVQEEEPQGKNTVARLRRKVASQVRGIHFLNLSSLLKADCEVDYGITKLIVNYAIAFVVIALIGLVYALELPYVLILCLVYFLFGPSLVYFHHRKKYEKKKFATCVRYIEQMIFSFTRNTKLLNALEETNVLMTGKIHDAIESAIVKIRHGKNNNSLYSEALKEIEEFFPCVRVKNLHELLIGVERDGGRYTSSLDIMLEDVREWDIRSNNFQQEQTVKGISMVISILMSLGVCFFMTNILPDDMGGDISGFGLYQFITTLSLVVMFFIYRLSARKLTSSWVNDDLGEDEGRIQSDYKAVKKYNENPQGKIKPIFAITRMQTAMEKALKWK